MIFVHLSALTRLIMAAFSGLTRLKVALDPNFLMLPSTFPHFRAQGDYYGMY